MQGSQNLKVGFLFLLFLALMFWATLMVKGGIKGIFPSGKTLVARFDSVEGLKKGDKVLFAGVPVGKVTEVEFHPKHMLVNMLIQQEGIIIYRSAVIEAEDVSTLGGKQISISRGDPLLGEIDWTEIQLATAKPPLSEAVQDVTETLNDFVEENRKDFSDILENLKQTTANLKEVSDRVNAGEGTAGKFLNDPALYDNLNNVAGNANTLIAGIVEGKGSIGPLFNRPEIYERIEFITRQMVTGRGFIGQLLKNESLYNNIEGVVINVERITRSLAEGRGTLGRLFNDPDLYDNIDAIVGRMNRGEGTLGKLLTDEVLYSEVREVVSNLKGVARSFESVARKMDEGRGSVGKLVNDPALYDKATETVDSAKDILGAFKKFRTFIGASGKYHAHQRMWATRVFLRIEPSPSKFLQVGASWLTLDPDGQVTYEGSDDGDRGDDTYLQPEIQLGFKYFDNMLTLRLGLLEGQFGGGLDFDVELPILFDSQFRVTFEGRMAFSDSDLDGTEIDEDVRPFMARFEASLYLFGFVRLYVGANNLFDSIGFTGGVGFEFHDDDIRNLIGLISLAG